MNHCHKLEWIWPTQKNKTRVESVAKNSRRFKCLTNLLEILHRAASKVYSGCLSSTPIPLLIETQLTLLKTTLKHQALSCFERALRLLPEAFNLSAFGVKSVISRLNQKPSWWSYWFSAQETLLSLSEPLIICSPIPFGLLWSLEYHLPYLTA